MHLSNANLACGHKEVLLKPTGIQIATEIGMRDTESFKVWLLLLRVITPKNRPSTEAPPGTLRVCSLHGRFRGNAGGYNSTREESKSTNSTRILEILVDFRGVKRN